MLGLLVHDLSRIVFLWATFSNYTYLLLPPALIIYQKYINYNKAIGVNMKKTSELKNSINKMIKEKIRMPFLYAQQG